MFNIAKNAPVGENNIVLICHEDVLMFWKVLECYDHDEMLRLHVRFQIQTKNPKPRIKDLSSF